MIAFSTRLQHLIRQDGAIGLIEIVAVEGSSPREIGTCMAVRANGEFIGSIGGGALEWNAIAEMRRILQAHPRDGSAATPAGVITRSIALGPELGQCCGGRVRLAFRCLTMADLDPARHHAPAWAIPDQPTDLALFGAGHVGRALVLALAPLPFAIRWIDPRPDAFPAAMPANVTPIRLVEPQQALFGLAHDTLVAVMTHDHALDLALCDAALHQPHVRFLGLIGSETKRSRFLARLRQAGHRAEALDHLTCPIGDRRIPAKDPASIAAGIVVQLLLERALLLDEGTTTPRAMTRGPSILETI